MLGIDPKRIYFREDIARLWNYNYDPSQYDDEPAAKRQALLEAQQDRLRKWFHRNFTGRGLRVFRTAGRVTIHGRHLAAWVFNESMREDE